MNYISLYRKYRPNNFDKVIGQFEIIKSLKNSIINNTFSHAYLFSGPHGTGKTSVAKIFAKAINCINLNNGNNCNMCINCCEINNGNSIDIFEIDAASNNGIDEIKEIINNIQLLPIIIKYKIYIIDEIHMLTNSAFNALLKTLEEPPQYIIFIFATTESYKIPITIISRCQQYNFRKISKIELENNMINILNKEKVKYDLIAIKEIVNLSNGSVRDSLNILEQVIIFDNNITLKIVNNIFGMVSKTVKLELLKNILEYKVADVLLINKKIYESGSNIKILMLNILEMLKEIFIFKNTNSNIFLNFFSEIQIKIFANELNSKELINLIDLFMKAVNEIWNNIREEIYFELILLKALEMFKNNIKNLKNLKLNELIILNNKEKKENFEIILKQFFENKENIENNINYFNKKYLKYLFSKKNILNKNNNEIYKKKEIKLLDFKFNLDKIITNKKTLLLEMKFNLNEKKVKKIIDLHKYRFIIKNKINIYKLSNINYSNNQIFNILIKAKKKEREKFKNKFMKLIKERKKNIELNKLISFYDVKYVAASEQGIIIVTNTKPEANWISHEMCDLKFRNNIFKIFNFDFIIIPLSESEWNIIHSDYFKNKQENKLFNLTLINVKEFYKKLSIKQINNYYKHKELLKIGKKIFNNIKIV